MRVLILSSICVLLLFGCKEDKHSQVKLEDFDLIEGEWLSENRREVWQKTDSAYFGQGYENNELFEHMWIIKSGDRFVYRVKILRSGAVKEFGLFMQNPNLFHFTLPENDFPSEVIYYFDTFSELKITLVGKQGDEEIKMELPFSRKPS